MFDHIQYLNILAQPLFYKSLLPSLHKLIKSHHQRFFSIYLKENDIGFFINIHLGMH